MENKENFSKMRIGILTFHSALNTGAVLQAYALQVYLDNLGHQTEFINYRAPIKHDLKDYIAKKPIVIWHKWLNRIHALKYENQKIDFAEILHRGEILYTNLSELQNNPPQYDIYIAGSDQIWNIGSTDFVNEVYFLNFGTNKIKKIAYAASMGQCNVPQILDEKIKELLTKFSAISLREAKAVNYIQSLFSENKKVYLVPDPTFLLSMHDYKRLLSHRIQENPYIASYILAEYSNEQKEAVNFIKKLKGLDLINLRNPDTCVRLKTAKNTIVKPREWLNHILYAEFVICCSFHAVVFSLIFHKPFIVITPYENERISSLLNIMEMRNRIFLNFNSDKISKLLNEEILWEVIDNKMLIERAKGVKFLEESLIK